MNLPPIVSPQEWEAARERLLVEEKQPTRARDVLAELGAQHILIPLYTPRWNGRIARFWHTLDSEWAHSRVWPNSTRRDRALQSFLR